MHCEDLALYSHQFCIAIVCRPYCADLARLSSDPHCRSIAPLALSWSTVLLPILMTI